MSDIDIERAYNFLKGGDKQTVVTIVGHLVRIERNGDTLEIAREHTGGIDWLVIKLNGKRIHQG